MPTRLLDKRWPWFAGAALLGLLYLATLVEVGLVDPRPVGTAEDIERLAEREDLKVLYILIDTLRADRLSAYGYPRETSPTLDWVSDSGVRFDRNLAQSSWTKCSMASLWTSLLPQRTGVLRFRHTLPEEATTPAEILSEAGFRTVGLFRNGWVASNFGFDQGFEVYHHPKTLSATPNMRRQNPSMKDSNTDDSVLDAFRSFLRVSGHERWFVYLHLMDLHQFLYDAQSALFGTSTSDIYDNSIRREDSIVLGILDALIEAGVYDKTLVVISSDHGEAFRERGLEGHARNVYPEVTEVPWILSFPFQLESELVIGARTQNVDIWPTVLDLLGLPALEPSDGKSRVPMILAAARGENVTEDGELAVAHLDKHWGKEEELPKPHVSVSSGSFRYMLTQGVEGETEREELFDRTGDPLEVVDIGEQNPEQLERLRAAATDYLSGEPPWEVPADELELSEMEKGQLRALGYAVP